MIFQDDYIPPKKRRKKASANLIDLGTLLNRFLNDETFGQTIHLKKIRENFTEIVGELLFPYVSAEKLEKGILTLKTASSVWKAELFSQKKAIIGRCNSLLKTPIVKEIKFL
jgi:hypothetical protein